MNLSNIIFPDSLRKIDLHGCDRLTATVLINDFIEENYKLKNEIFTIVHGVGTGILRNTTREVLKKNKRVIEYKIENNNSGMTLVKIKL